MIATPLYRDWEKFTSTLSKIFLGPWACALWTFRDLECEEDYSGKQGFDHSFDLWLFNYAKKSN